MLIMASYRLAYLVTREEGPLEIASRIRGRLDPDQKTWLGRGLNCALCVSFWTSLLMVILWLLPGIVSTVLIIWLAVAGGALLINRWMNK